MFETQKVHRHDKFRKEWSQHQSRMGQDQKNYIKYPILSYLNKREALKGKTRIQRGQTSGRYILITCGPKIMAYAYVLFLSESQTDVLSHRQTNN